jgi:hypothetical protein
LFDGKRHSAQYRHFQLSVDGPMSRIVS